MTMTLAEFTEIIQFAAQLFYGVFYTLQNTPVYQDGGVTVSWLDLLAGIFIIGILTDLILEWIHGASE